MPGCPPPAPRVAAPARARRRSACVRALAATKPGEGRRCPALTLIGYIKGLATNLELEAQAERDSGMTDTQWMQEHERTFLALFASGEYPSLAASTTGPGLDLELDTVFEFGLQRLLDGYTTLGAPGDPPLRQASP